LAEEIEADLIVVGSARHGRVGQILAGSVGVALLQGSPCAVGIAPNGYRDRSADGIAAVAIGFDGSDESGLALIAASRLASETGAKLKLISVAEPPPIVAGKAGDAGWQELTEAIQAQTREQLVQALEAVPDRIEVEASLITGDPVQALVNVAEAPGTLLVVGSRGYGPLRRVLLGSVSTRLARSAPCPLIVTPRGMRDTAGAAPSAEVGAAS
jgi:nucleotide-binding universal stress UspA family protein